MIIGVVCGKVHEQVEGVFGALHAGVRGEVHRQVEVQGIILCLNSMSRSVFMAEFWTSLWTS